MTTAPPLLSTNLRNDGRLWWRSLSSAIREHAEHNHLRADQDLLAADHVLSQLVQTQGPQAYREFIQGAADEVQDSINRLRAERLPRESPNKKFASPRLLVLPASGQGARGRTWFLNCLHAHYACAMLDDPACEDRLHAAHVLVAQAVHLSDVGNLSGFVTGAMTEAEERIAALRASCEQHPVRVGRWTAR